MSQIKTIIKIRDNPANTPVNTRYMTSWSMDPSSSAIWFISLASLDMVEKEFCGPKVVKSRFCYQRKNVKVWSRNYFFFKANTFFCTIYFNVVVNFTANVVLLVWDRFKTSFLCAGTSCCAACLLQFAGLRQPRCRRWVEVLCRVFPLP